MGVKNKERRAVKAKQRQRRAQARSAQGYGHWPHAFPLPTPREDIEDLVNAAASHLCQHGSEAPNPHQSRLVEILGTVDDRAGLVEEVLVDFTRGQLEQVWRRGWQPADVARVMRRNHSAAATAIGIDAMAAHIATFPASTVDERFTLQLAALDADPARGGAAGFVTRWLSRLGLTVPDAVAAAIEFLHALSHLPDLPVFCPPPGHARPTRRSGVTTDAKVLERVRNLLAKAEASEFTDEADTFTAKAQELIARHSIDLALLAAGPTRSGASPDQPTGIRVGIDNPYEQEKAILLGRVAAANRCRCVWSRELGFITVLGFPADLRAVELLYTSLLVQCTRAMLREGTRRHADGGSRTRSFRQAFQRAFGVRIGERLAGVTSTREHESAAADERLLPVLAGREQAVKVFGDEIFPGATNVTYNAARYDREGWELGTHAANLAPLDALPSLQDTATATNGAPADDADADDRQATLF